MTISEASDFFDKHNIFEFDDVTEVKDVKFALVKKKYIGLDSELFQKIRKKTGCFFSTILKRKQHKHASNF